MTSDLQALLAAIVADPADDTARLAYADCLQEHGNAARAEFIRLQVEAERHHPDSNARGAMEDRARVLFAAHWQEWWNEVCAATGFEPVGYQVSESGTAVREAFPESPYDDFDDVVEPQRPRALLGSIFRRGFPESVTFSSIAPNREAVVANFDRWRTVSPLVEFITHAWPEVETNWWPYERFLRTVTTLEFNLLDLDVVGRALRSPHLANVERLTIRPSYAASGSQPSAARVALAATLCGPTQTFVCSDPERRIARVGGDADPFGVA